MVPGPIGPKLGRSVGHVGKGSGAMPGTLCPMSGVPGWARGASGGPWGPVGASLGTVQETKVAGHKRFGGVIMVWNFTLVFTSQSMDPGRFCSRGPLADGSQTWYKFWPQGNNSTLVFWTLPHYSYPSQHDRESAGRPRRGRPAPTSFCVAL